MSGADPRRLLVTGAGGMLGRDVVRAARRGGHQVRALPRAELDITDPRAVGDAFVRWGPDAVINCAAWTDVDGAEYDPEGAHAVNAFGAGELARAAAAHDAVIVHVSSDYVFSGETPRDERGAPRPYVESDAPGPRSVYGESKLAGERQVLAASPRHAVARSAWLFGLDGRNYVATMLALASEREVVRVVSDQVGSPTWTGHLAPALVGLVEREVDGLVHLAAAGHVSWHGFAQEIFALAGVSCRVEAVSSVEMARPAPRPAWSALASERGEVAALPEWRDGLSSYLAARAGIMGA
jgi:dTDP-4-dehydrorhamnose reductase